jgi:hypothetical protein
MADAKPPSTSDLCLLIAGLRLVKNPDTSADFGEDYYLNPPVSTSERTLRESLPNPLYLNSPQKAWNDVHFRDWLIATLFGNIAGNKHDFTAITEPVLYSKDLLAKTFEPHMAGATDTLIQMLNCDSGERTYRSTLTLGISKQTAGTKEVFLFGAGMRRRVELTLKDSGEALRVDLEFFVPFYILPNSDHDDEVSKSSVRSICAGIAITNNKGVLGTDEDKKELVGMRFNLRVPVKAETGGMFLGAELRTEFGTPEINIQRLVKNAITWEEFTNWEKFVETFFDKDEISDLLNSPAGPLLAEKISDEAGLKDIILKQSKRDEIKKGLGRAKEDLDDTLYLLKHVYEWQPPDKDDPNPDSGSRKLGSVLASLGFMTGEPAGDGEFEYTFGIADNLTVWSVLDRILGELDGFPLYASGLERKKPRTKRIVAALASQPDPIDRTKNYFGLAAAAYNILLNPVKDSSAKNGDKDETSIVLTKDNFTDDESILIEPEEDEQEVEVAPEEEATLPEKKGEQSRTEFMLHLGKWFSGETLDDNWLLRLLPKSDDPGQQRVPLPGIRLLPFKWTPSTDYSKATFSWTLVVDLVSLGLDIQGTTKDGLKFIDGLAGYFGLGAIELRVAFKLSLEDIYTKKGFFDRVALGVGVKLKDMRLSLGLSEEQKKKKEEARKKNQKVEKGDEIIEGLQELLADDWVVVPKTDTKPAKRDVKTRLSAKKKDKFSISVGYLTPLKDGSHGTLDVQLYDSDGNRGEMVLIPIDRFGEPVYLKQIGIQLKGVENLKLDEGLPDTAQLTVSLTGGLRVPGFELGFIGANLTFQLNDASKFKFTLDGLDVSVKFGDVIISGSFMKVGIEYAGSLTVSIPKGSFSAMGFFGSVVLFKMKVEDLMARDLNLGSVPEKMLPKLTENNVTPIKFFPVTRAPGGGWELNTTDNTKYLISFEDGELFVLRPDKTFFIYITLSAAGGTGIPLGPIQITGFVGGFGYNRRLKVPTIENVAAFPLVQIVMGKGGYQSEDETFELHNQLAKPVEDPAAVLEKMKKSLVPELGQYFACAGLRFTINGTIDCFALAIVQWGDDKIEITLMGLARFRLPRDTTARAICYVEILILMTIKPSEGTFKLQALLSSNSWVINTDCKLTGGLALFIWFDGEHKGDIVFTIGGYHPRFRRPDHYPIVPRLGLNWRVNDNLSIKGGCYFALTPSCGMVGAKLEAYFHSGRISAWFTAYLDVIINWTPLYFEAELGISLKVQASFFLFDIDVTISASIEMWGPPVGGIAHIDLTVCKFDIDFGPKRPPKPELIDKWETFCHNFLNLKGQDRRAVNAPVVAFPVIQPNLGAGRNNLNNLANAKRKQTQPKPEDEIWKVRADELELAATATVPVTTMNVGQMKTSDGVQARSTSGRSMMVTTPVSLDSNGLSPKKSANKLGVHPMGRAIDSVLNVTIVHDDASLVEPVELSGWTVEEEKGSLPAALWEPGVPNMRPTEPTANMVDGCITGLKRLKPPRGALGKQATPPPIEWHKLAEGRVPPSSTTQKKPGLSQNRNMQPLVVQKQDNQKKIVAALSTIGFPLEWKEVPQAEVRFRELQANPLAGEVAA